MKISVAMKKLMSSAYKKAPNRTWKSSPTQSNQEHETDRRAHQYSWFWTEAGQEKTRLHRPEIFCSYRIGGKSKRHPLQIKHQLFQARDQLDNLKSPANPHLPTWDGKLQWMQRGSRFSKPSAGMQGAGTYRYRYRNGGDQAPSPYLWLFTINALWILNAQPKF
jgi:hypothetical protein